MDAKENKKYHFSKYIINCGTTDEKYKSIIKMAYVSNFNIWKFLHIFITILFGGLTIASFIGPELIAINSTIFTILFVYFLIMSCLFFTAFREDSIISQLAIYLSMIALMCFGLYQSIAKSEMIAVAFFVIMIVLPTIMIDRPIYMGILLICASGVFIAHSYMLKSGLALFGDVTNCIVFCIIGIVMNTIYNTLRVKEFLLQKQIEEERDTDSLTGLLNKNSLMTQINGILSNKTSSGVMMIIDIDNFKSINDTYGHSYGDLILAGIGTCLNTVIPDGNITGRFGGDEFIVFLKNQEDIDNVETLAEQMIEYVNTNIHTPNRNEIIGICIGISAIDKTDYDYDSVFRKSDEALYTAKNQGRNTYSVYSK